MATVINNPSGTVDDSGAGVVIGVVIALLIIVLFFAFALPYLQNGTTPGVPNTGTSDGGSAEINVQLPDMNSGGTGGGSGNGSNSY